jgi:hypothetical protein
MSNTNNGSIRQFTSKEELREWCLLEEKKGKELLIQDSIDSMILERMVCSGGVIDDYTVKAIYAIHGKENIDE